MNCLDVRRQLGEEPSRRSPELSAHLAGCPACAAFAAEAQRLESLIVRALEISVPPARDRAPASGPVAADRPRAATRWYALAASVAGVAVLIAAIWSFQPREALAAALVDHLAHEPDAWATRDVAVPAGALAYVLGRSGVALAPDAPLVSYASSCDFRGWHVPHLVVQTPEGPMTVMVLPHERVAGPTPFDEGGYRGVIVPATHGSFAVIARGPVEPRRVDAVAAAIAAVVRVTG